ncbi:MAG: M20 family metallopeptidase [Gordonia sp. (in: high G+C Gram-positive bacteria)]|uniref:M20 metallopeptidase family protein n=1 Tax=Gordonia sp. (in: high G+C Gram-positive bacteria) TaxID=84139 RepID=UPI0039E37989
MGLLRDARELSDGLVGLRRAIHADPEVGLQLPRTQRRILDALDGLGCEITVGKELSSVVGVLRGGAADPGRPRPAVLLRADMDALPIREQSAVDFASRTDDMHACGHDLHVACLVGAARLLAARRDALPGDVVLMFQPGEEEWNGAAAMLDEGVLTASGRQVDAAYALHVSADRLPAHRVACRPGPFLSASTGFDVRVVGSGTHAATPHLGRDPVPATAEMIGALQTAVTRRFDAFDPVVLTVGVVRAGTRANIIPETATFSGTVRTFSAANQSRVPELITETVTGIARAHGVRVDVDVTPGYPVTVNDAAETDRIRRVVTSMLGPDGYEEMPCPSVAAEDFSRILQRVPGAMFFLGACPEGRDPATAPSNHDPRAVFDDAVLPDGAALLAALAIDKLDDLTGRDRPAEPV